MGLDIYARKYKKSDWEAQTAYSNENWPKVETGEMTHQQYIENCPHVDFVSLDVTEFGIRKFYSLRKYLKTLLNTDEDTEYILNRAQAYRLMTDAKCGFIDFDSTDFDYARKCAHVYAICTKFINDSTDEDVLNFFFCE